MVEDVICPVCSTKSSKGNVIEKYDYYNGNSPTMFILYHCPDCGVEFWNPRVISKEFYEEDKYGIYKHSFLKKDSYTTPFLKFPPVKNGMLLDIGCGCGEFLSEAQNIGFDVYGIDLNRNAVDTAKGKGLSNVYPVFLGDFLRMAEEKGLGFDVVTFFEVLEHQDYPLKFLTELRHLLRPGGWIAGSVPYRSYGSGDYPPHHFTLWREKPIVRILEKDFEDISVTYLYDYSTIKGKMLQPLSLFLASRKKEGRKEAGKPEATGSGVLLYRLLKTARDTLFLPLTIPERIIRRMLGMPTNYYFQARLKGSRQE